MGGEFVHRVDQNGHSRGTWVAAAHRRSRSRALAWGAVGALSVYVGRPFPSIRSPASLGRDDYANKLFTTCPYNKRSAGGKHGRVLPTHRYGGGWVPEEIISCYCVLPAVRGRTELRHGSQTRHVLPPSAHGGADPRLAPSHQTERQSLSSRLSVFVSSSRNRPFFLFAHHAPENAQGPKSSSERGGQRPTPRLHSLSPLGVAPELNRSHVCFLAASRVAGVHNK